MKPNTKSDITTPIKFSDWLKEVDKEGKYGLYCMGEIPIEELPPILREMIQMHTKELVLSILNNNANSK